MQLKQLLDGVKIIDGNVDMDTKINEVRTSSKEVTSGDLFIAMKGLKADGNDYIADMGGDVVVLSEVKPPEGVKYVLVEDVRLAYGKVAANRYARPLDDMKFIAVVGTNGKTSTAHYIASLLNFAGMKCGVIGTEGHYVDGEKIGESMTTPDPLELNELLGVMRSRGCEAVVAEVSAHAIYFQKLGDAKADIAVLTNVSQDHLDFFGTFEKYARVKASFFTPDRVGLAIVNSDDAIGRSILQGAESVGLKAIGYGLNNPAECFAVRVREDIDGISFVANLSDEIVEVRSPLYGEFNVYNLLAAMSVAKYLGIDASAIRRGAGRIKPVKGRFSVLRSEKGTLIIDFAHTPEGLRSLLSTARTLTKSRLITVFGCGGERDRSKRKRMGEIASQFSDGIVLTSDNPRGEDPEKIIRDIELGVCIKDVKCLPDRTEAIRYALGEMEEGDTLVIAGKGNENYMEIRGEKIPYSDFDVVSRYGQLR